MKKIVAAVLMSAAVAAPAFAADAPAADSGFYMGANVGFTRTSAISGYTGTTNGDPSKATGGLFSLLAGYQVNKYFAGEIQYAYLGKAEYASTAQPSANTKTNSFGLNAVGMLPVSDSFGFYGKAGLALNTSSVSGFATGYDGQTRFMPTIGLGMQWNVIPTVGLRMGWDRYDANIKDSASTKHNYHKNAWSLGGLYRF